VARIYKHSALGLVLVVFAIR